MDLDLTGSVSGDPFNPELPAGGARQASISGVAQADRHLPEGALSSISAANRSSEMSVAIEPDFGCAIGGEGDKGVSTLAAQEAGYSTTAQAGVRRADSDSAFKQPQASAEAAPAPTEVLGITVLAGSDQAFQGAKLKQCFITAGLRFGPHDVFHLYDVDYNLQERPLISVTNALEPRTFDLAKMSDFSTKAITLYLPLPGPADPEEAFGRFLTLADQLAKQLSGQLCDLYQKPLSQARLIDMHQRLLEACEVDVKSGNIDTSEKDKQVVAEEIT
jgi:cell division protein ZipA